jgi:hypothetical protein
VLPDEKYDRAFGIKVKEAGGSVLEVFIVLYLFFFLFYSVAGQKNMTGLLELR